MSEPRLKVPEEVMALLGDDPQREALEALLLHLIRTDRASVAWAGQRLGLDRREAIRWYASHGHPYPDPSREDLEEDFSHAERSDEQPRRARGGATGREVTMYYDPETGEPRQGRPDFP